MKEVFNPKSIAIIGASSDENKVGGILVKNAKISGLKIIPINPKSEKIQSLTSYKSILDYPSKIDLAIISVPKKYVRQSVKQCAKKRVKNIIIISAGFSEEGHKWEEKRIVKIAKKNKIRILGPNCFGIANPHKNLSLTFAKTIPKKGDIAFLSQSGALWSYLSDFSDKIGYSSFASLGNMSDVDFSDLIEYFSKDELTKSIVLYIEKLNSGKKFISICKNSKKKIYAVKAGSSKEGSKAAVSHTGSLATDYKIYEGAFKQSNVILCDSLEEAIQRASKKKLFHKKRRFNISSLGKKVQIITNAGGAGALAADYLSEKGYKLVDSSYSKNPNDILGTANSEDYLSALNLSLLTKADFTLLIATPQIMTDLEDISNKILEFKAKTKNKKLVVLYLGNLSTKKSSDLLRKNKIPVFNTLKEFKNNL